MIDLRPNHFYFYPRWVQYLWKLVTGWYVEVTVTPRRKAVYRWTNK